MRTGIRFHSVSPEAWRAPAALVVLAVLGAVACGERPGAEEEGRAGGEAVEIRVAEVGFRTPESVLYDSVADVYLVSSIDGNPTEKDGNGFISRLSPEGEVLELRWIAGGEDGVVLHAPKGMAIRGDTLFVADIDCIRLFHRITGEPAGEVCIPGSTFLNDLAVGPDGTLYVSDSGGREPTDAVYRLGEELEPEVVISDPELGGPNGLWADADGLFVVTFGSGEVFRITPGGERIQLLEPSDMQLDGIVAVGDGGFLFSSWGDSAVYEVGLDGVVRPLVEGVAAPADIGYDARRGRVLIPLFRDDAVLIRTVG